VDPLFFLFIEIGTMNVGTGWKKPQEVMSERS
jgi:hypothetical protein